MIFGLKASSECCICYFSKVVVWKKLKDVILSRDFGIVSVKLNLFQLLIG